MEIKDVEKEVDKIVEEIQEFTDYSPEGKTQSIEYLYTARKVANSYDRIMASDMGEGTIAEIALLRHHLMENPQYLDFHDDS